jgi:hypothetical protein
MDAETHTAIAQLATRLEQVARDVAERVRWYAEQHEREWKNAAAWRTHWTTELDALIIEVEIVKVAVRALEQHMSDTNESQSERIYRKVNELTKAFADVLFEMLPEDRQPLKDRFSKTLGDLLAEVIGGSTVMAAGVVVALDKRMTRLEEKQVGDVGR